MKNGNDSAYAILRARIVGGYYAPGTQLKEEHLAKEFALSRTPVRTALLRLVDDELAVAHKGRGIRVAEWSDWDVKSVTQIRYLLEPFAAELAAEHADAAILQRLHDANALMDQAITAANIEEVQFANQAFHTAILDGCGSPRIKAILEPLIDMPIILKAFDLYETADLQQSLQHHRDLVWAIELKDGELARQVMQLHIRVAQHRLLRRRSESAAMGHPDTP